MSSPDDLVGRCIAGKYEVLSKIGAGAMGNVYRVRHLKLKRERALKVLTRDRPDIRERFLREAELASRIEHPNVVQVFDCGIDGDLPYYEMELLTGESLAATLRRERRLPWPRARHILLQICAAVEAAHLAGIIHRDLKPENCVRITHQGDSDYVKILDFGIAKVATADIDSGESDHLTQTGDLLGTTPYMAPEQTHGARIDHRIDVYAIGVIAFHLLTGRLPFRGTAAAIIVAINTQDAPSMASASPAAGIPRALEDVVARAMARDPARRYSTAAALGAAFFEIPADAPAEPSGPEDDGAPNSWSDTQVNAETDAVGASVGSRIVEHAAKVTPTMLGDAPTTLAAVAGPSVSPGDASVGPERPIAPKPSWAPRMLLLVGVFAGLTVLVIQVWIRADERVEPLPSPPPAGSPPVAEPAPNPARIEQSSAKPDLPQEPDPVPGTTGEEPPTPLPLPTTSGAPAPARQFSLAEARKKIETWQARAGQERAKDCALGIDWDLAGTVKIGSSGTVRLIADGLTPQKERCRKLLEVKLRRSFKPPFTLDGTIEGPFKVVIQG